MLSIPLQPFDAVTTSRIRYYRVIACTCASLTVSDYELARYTSAVKCLVYFKLLVGSNEAAVKLVGDSVPTVTDYVQLCR